MTKEQRMKGREKRLQAEADAEQKIYEKMDNIEIKIEPLKKKEKINNKYVANGKECPHITWVKKHLINNGVNLVIVGKTGSGKSFAGLKLACAIQPDFSIDQVCFSVEEFMRVVPILPKKSVIILEEASVNADARRFWSDLNQAMVYITETFRASNLLFIANLPSFNGLDSRIRGLVHNLIITKKVYPKEKVCKVKWFKTEVNPISGKLYRKYWRRNSRPIKLVRFGLPPKELVKQYLDRKATFRVDLHDKITLGIQSRKQKDKNMGYFDAEKAADEVVNNKEKFLRVKGEKTWIDNNLICAYLKVGSNRGTAVRLIAERKLGISPTQKLLPQDTS